MNFLSGYKTYITAIAGVVTAVAMYANGQEPVGDMITQVIAALSAAFIRHGITTTAAK